MRTSSAVSKRLTVWPATRRPPSTFDPNEQVRAQQGDARHGAPPTAPSGGAAPGGPTRAGPTAAGPRPGPSAPRAAPCWPLMPWWSSRASVPFTVSAAAAWPYSWTDAQAEVPVVLGVGHGVDLGEQRGGLHVARLVQHAQVDLELGPVGRQGVEHRLEVVGQSHADSLPGR